MHIETPIPYYSGTNTVTNIVDIALFESFFEEGGFPTSDMSNNDFQVGRESLPSFFACHAPGYGVRELVMIIGISRRRKTIFGLGSFDQPEGKIVIQKNKSTGVGTIQTIGR